MHELKAIEQLPWEDYVVQISVFECNHLRHSCHFLCKIQARRNIPAARDDQNRLRSDHGNSVSEFIR